MKLSNDGKVEMHEAGGKCTVIAVAFVMVMLFLSKKAEVLCAEVKCRQEQLAHDCSD